MIVGNGLLASCLKRQLNELHSDVVYFASGVSSSSELNVFEFEREVNLLSEYLLGSLYIVYFSTCSIYDKDLINSPYVQHKLRIENRLRSRGNSLIIRLPQVVGSGGNKNTLLNYFYDNIVQEKVFDAWANAERSLIDVEDVVYFSKKLVEYCMHEFFIVNVSAPSNISVVELIKLVEKKLGLRARYNLINAGSSYSIDVSFVKSLFENYSEIFNDNYFESIVTKYCQSKR